LRDPFWPGSRRGVWFGLVAQTVLPFWARSDDAALEWFMHKMLKVVRSRSDNSNRSRCAFEAFERLEGRRLMAAHIVGNPNTYATIQAAVDAALPGGIINVDAGSYAEQVYVGKSLTIRGAQAGNDARSNARISGIVSESVITGATTSGGKTSAFYVAVDNVTLDGFTVQGQTTAGDAGAGVVIAPGKSGTHFLNNIVQNNVSGLFLANASSTNPAVIQYNLFRNNNNAGANGGRGIYTNGGISGGNLTNVLIDSNAFLNNRGGSGTTTLEAAIAFESRTAGTQSNITITNNTFDANGKATLFFNTVGVLLKGNSVTNTLDQYSGTLRFEGNVQNVQILNNNLYDNTGPAVAVDSKGMPGNNSGFVVNYNNIYNNSLGYGSRYGVVYDGSAYDGVFDARYNYWGSSTGPGGDGPGTGDKVYGIGHVVSGGQWYVATGGTELYSPWSTTINNGAGTAPYFGLPSSDGAVIQFEDFDHGGQGIAYNDTTTGNAGGKYRPREQVDIETSSDTGAGFDIYNAVAGEWLGYTINLQQGGVFQLDTRVATAQTTGGKFHVEIDGVNVTGSVTISRTGGAQVWQTISTGGISLSAGQHTLRYAFDSNGSSGTIASFNYFKLTNTSPVPIPATPTNLVATASGFAAVNLSWSDNATDETGYVVERQTPAGTWTQIASLSLNATTYIDTTVLSSATYNYRVRALGAAGNSAYSTIATVTTPAAQSVTYLSDLPFAGTPINGWGPIERDQTVGGSGADDGQTMVLNGVSYTKGLGTNAISDVSFNLGGAYKSFLADIGVDDKQLYDGTVNFMVYADGVKVYDSGVMTPDSATQTINLDITGVQTLRLYVGDAGDGPDFDQADWANARLTLAAQTPPPAPTAPAAPTGLAATAISSSQVDLAWTGAPDATGYKIERSIDGVTFTQIGTSTTASYSDLTASASTSYTYRVRATNSVGDSDYSNTSTATTPAAPTVPAAPSSLVASAISSSRIDLTWSASATATGYKIERSIDGVNFTQIGTGTAANYSDLTAAASTSYTYRVRATNSVGDSDYSAIASATTPAAPVVPTVPAAPATLIATAATTGAQITLTWADNSSDETGFKIERSLDGVTFAQVGTTAANVATYTDSTGLSASTKYYYRVSAFNAVGSSTLSNIASATTAAPASVPLTLTAGSIGFVGPLPSIALANSIYTVKGAGAGIDGKADSFTFAYQQLTGDGTIIARVSGVQNTSSTAQAGILMRNDLTAGSAEAGVLANASSLFGVTAVTRTTAGAKAATSNSYFVSTPVWLKIVRKGNVFTTYRSTNGTTWTQMSSTTIAMNQTIYVGLAVASQSNSVQNTSTFDNVSILK
jgi:regulation of enolase protein 1 (concanavalin A-like superfamily)